MLPSVGKIRLNNGVPVYLLKEGDQELVRIDFVFKAGKWYESESLIANTTNNLLNEGTTRYTSKKLAEMFDFYGAYLQFYSESDRVHPQFFSKFINDRFHGKSNKRNANTAGGFATEMVCMYIP